MLRSRKTIPCLVLLVVVCVAPRAHAQFERILVARTATFSTNPVGSALTELGLRFTTVVTFEDLLDQLQSRQWDLVSIRGKNPFSIELEGQILDELEAHVARGGALHFQMSRLDEVRTPRYYELLGLEGAVDVQWPLEDLVVPSPPHPIWNSPAGGTIRPTSEPIGNDLGDDLILGPSSFAVASSGVDGLPAIAIAADGRVVVNGPEWDNWPDARYIVREQIRWLLSCKADLDLDGDLTIFDFIEFQNLFDRRDVRADVFYDGRFDIFDFLAFLNVFEQGCR